VKNANQAVAQVKAVEGSINQAGTAAKNTASLFKLLIAATALLALAFKAAASDERMYLMLRALTHSSAIALSQIKAIRQESEKGIFDKEELFEARKMLDATGASIKDLLPLAEELSLRSDKGLGEVAKVLGGLAGGGMTRLGLFLRAAGITVNELRKAGLSVSKNYQVSGSPQHVLDVLKNVLAKENIGDALGGSLSASFKGIMAALTDLFRSLGAGLAPIIKPAASLLEGLLKTLTWLNDITHGWIGNILLAVAAMRTIAVVLPIMRALVDYEKLAAYWQGILIVLNNPWGAIAGAIVGVAKALMALASVEKVVAAWTAIVDALSGNWVALGAGAAVAAAVGVAWHFANSGGGDERDGPAAERPIRRSDMENMMNRQRAKAWA
jgi:hypothetical protein